MKRYAFINVENGNVLSIVGWLDNRDLPNDYIVPENCNVRTIEDDNIDINYFYDSTSGSFKIKEIDENLITKNQILEQLAALDEVLPRCIEDIISTFDMDVTKLPEIMQERLQNKQSLRQQLQSLIT